METYPSEDGLSLDCSIGLASQLVLDEPNTEQLFDKPIQLGLAENISPLDLFYMESILATAGWNNNDDVFLSEELWAARHTPEDKPLNFQHNPRVVIGHIIKSYVLNRSDNTVVSDDAEEVPQDIHVATKSVLYKALGLNIDNDLHTAISKVIEEIKNGDWFVSMECIFKQFDYALLAQDGTQQIVKRTKETSFLTKKLRIYGGDGLYEGGRIGRIPRDFIFSGHGLVKKPANPNSVIFANLLPFRGINTDVCLIQSETQMSDTKNTELEARIAELVTELAEAKAALVKSETDKTTVETKLVIANESLTQVQGELAASQEVIKANETKITELGASCAQANSELATIKADTLKKTRLSEIKANCVFSNEELADLESSDQLVSMSDECFNILMKVAKANKAQTSKEEDKPEDDTATANATEMVDDATPEETVTPAVTTANEVIELRTSMAKLFEQQLSKQKVNGGK